MSYNRSQAYHTSQRRCLFVSQETATVRGRCYNHTIILRLLTSDWTVLEFTVSPLFLDNDWEWFR